MNNPHDYRLGHILHKGDQICADGAVYTIAGDPLGFGGTSILYPAISDGSKLEIAIKEAFPGGAARYHRCGGVIRPTDPNDVIALGQLEQYRKQLQREAELGQTIRNSSVRAIGLWKKLVPSAITVDGQNYTEVSDGIYSILERMDRKGMTFNQLLQYIGEPSSEDTPLKTGFLPKVHTTALIMEQVLLALQRVHTAGENGFLFGDIQDGNVFFSDCRLEQGDIGIGNLLDFGCARPLVDGNQTEEITDKQVFSTMGFIPPEILDPEKNNGTLRLTRAADIYSLGCLMLRCVLSSASIRCLGASPVVDGETIDEEAASRLGCPEPIRNLLNLILQRALQTEPKDRYSDTDAMLADIRKLKRDTSPPTYLLPKAPGSSVSFVEGSRDEEIRHIMQTLQVNTPAFLWGCGGIGKSEIAIKVAQEFEKISPKGAYFVHYTVPTDEKAEAMEETVLRMPFEGYKYEPEEQGMSLEEQRKADYRKRIGILRKEYTGALLVIDNFDWPGKTWADLIEEKSYQEIVSLGLNLVFTTRNEVPGTQEVKGLSREDLLKLMRRWCTDPKITDEQLLALIDAVDGHTLTVDIMSKTLEESWGDVTPEMMLDAIKGCKLAQVEYPEITFQSIVKGQDSERTLHRDQKTAQIYEHLKTLFDLSGMSEQDRTVLCCATLLPDSGMDAPLFRDCLETIETEALKNLVKRGWLSRTEGLLKIHPIIREVCKTELTPHDEICNPFLKKLENKYDSSHYDHIRYLQMAHCFAYASHILADQWGDYANCAGYFFGEIALFNEQLTYYKMALTIRERVLPPNHLDLAYSYNNIGYAYGQLGDFQKQLECCMKALAIREEVLPRNHPELAYSYHNIGYAYGDLGDFQKRLEFYQKALKILEEVLPQNHPELATLYNNIGYAYGQLGDFQKQLEFYQKALKIREEVLPKNHPDLATSYNNVGAAYGNLGDFQKQLEFSQKALKIQEEVLPKNHPDLAYSYNNIGTAYGDLGDFHRQLEFCLKALKIREEVLPKSHPDLAYSYNNIGYAYGQLGDFHRQLEFCLKALKIQEGVLPKNHPELAYSYNNIGYAYGRLGDFQKKLEFHQKALKIWEEVLPRNHPKLITTYEWIADACHNLEKYGPELTYLRKAVQLGSATAMNSLAKHLIDGDHCAQDYSEALLWLEKSHALGNPTGTNNLGWMYLTGNGVTQNINRAIELFEIAAYHPQKPSKASNRHLGRLYLGVHPDAPDFDGIDPVKALHYLKRAKELGADDVDDLIETACNMIDES